MVKVPVGTFKKDKALPKMGLLQSLWKLSRNCIDSSSGYTILGVDNSIMTTRSCQPPKYSHGRILPPHVSWSSHIISRRLAVSRPCQMELGSRVSFLFIRRQKNWATLLSQRLDLSAEDEVNFCSCSPLWRLLLLTVGQDWEQWGAINISNLGNLGFRSCAPKFKYFNLFFIKRQVLGNFLLIKYFLLKLFT